MARKPASEPLEIEEEMSALQQDVANVEADILSEFGQDVENINFVLKVYRVNGNNKLGGTEEWIFDCDPSELPINERLRDEFTTAGQSSIFRVRVIKNKRPYRQWDYRIFKPAGKAVAVQQNEMAGLAENLSRMFAEQQRQTLEILQRIEARHAAPAATDPLDMITKTIGLITGMQAAMPKAENSMIEVFKLGMEMRNSAEGGSETGILDVVKALAEKIDFSQFRFPPQPVQQPPQVALAAPPAQLNPRPLAPVPPVRQAGPVSHVPPPPPANGGIMQAFAPQLRQLADKAARGSDPELWADVLLEELPEPAMAALMNFPRENLVQECASVEPRVRQYEPWFSRLLAILREAWENEREAEPETAISRHGLHDTGRAAFEPDGDTIGAGGNESHAQENGGIPRNG